MNVQVANILMVEDNIGDIRLTQETIKRNKLRVELNVVMDGVEAISYLRQEGKYKNAVRPDIILLDLNLPKMDGREVLAEIKSDPELKIIPVVILTSSEADEDILKSYSLHANCYITKPVDFSQFNKVVNMLEDFWFAIVKLPRK